MAKAVTRTANLSPEAVEMLTVLSRECGDRSVRAFVDRVWVPKMRADYLRALAARLKRVKPAKGAA